MSHAAWMRQAESDLAAAKILSRENCHSQAVWLAGQAVEKSHKAILVALGLRYEEKHYKYLGHTTSEISKLLPAALHEPVDPQVATAPLRLDTPPLHKMAGRAQLRLLRQQSQLRPRSEKWMTPNV